MLVFFPLSSDKRVPWSEAPITDNLKVTEDFAAKTQKAHFLHTTKVTTKFLNFFLMPLSAACINNRHDKKHYKKCREMTWYDTNMPKVPRWQLQQFSSRRRQKRSFKLFWFFFCERATSLGKANVKCSVKLEATVGESILDGRKTKALNVPPQEL